MEFELGELFTHAARQVLPIAKAKGLVCLADCEGPAVVVHAEATALRHGLHDLFCAAIDALDSGFVFLAAELEPVPGAGCRFTAHAAGTGVAASPQTLARVLKDLGLAPEPPETAPPPPMQLARGRCARSGAMLTYVYMPPEGLVLTLRASLPGGSAPAEEPPRVAGARAWLLSDEPRGTQLVARRLQQHGWAVTAFASTGEAQRRLASRHPLANPPALVLGLESPAVTLAGLQALRAGLPRTQLVLGLEVGSMGPALAQGAAHGVRVCAFPFSPGDLRALTREAMLAGAQASASGYTEPMPLGFEDRPRVLVVDDNPVNQLVAGGMLQALGFEVEQAMDGDEAIARCRARAPDAVLMDLEMPGMGGLEATRRLRALQREGLLKMFPIIAASAGDGSTSRRSSLEAGMDAYLAKPLSLALLEAEIRRMLPSHR